MLENKFKTKLISELEERFPECMVIHVNEKQGMPDLLVLYKDKWASLEGKKSAKEKFQPNQPYYIEKMNNMSFSRVIYPENKEEVLHELSTAFNS